MSIFGSNWYDPVRADLYTGKPRLSEIQRHVTYRDYVARYEGGIPFRSDPLADVVKLVFRPEGTR